MASSVDTTFPADNVKVSKATQRAQNLIIYNEITALQQRTSVAGAKAFYGFVDIADLNSAVRRVHDEQASTFATDIAFGRVSLT
jgi:hypothetical protein